MIHTHERLVPQQRTGARREGDALQRGAHPGALGVAYAIYVWDGDAGLADGLFDEADDPGAVMEGGFLGEEAFAGGSVVGVAEVGEDDGGRGGGVGDDAYADFVGGTFEAEGYRFFHFWERVGFEVLGIRFVLFFFSL